MPPAARTSDPHTCPAHGGGPIVGPGATSVLIGGLPAARLSDDATCSGIVDTIMSGTYSVMIERLAASRVGDPTAHEGVIVYGEPSVLIED